MINLNLFPLTKLQKEVLISTVILMRTLKYSPTNIEISEVINNISPSMTRHVINALVKKGYLTKTPACHRSLALSDKLAKLHTRQIKRLPQLKN